MNGLHMFNKDAIGDFIDSRFKNEYLLSESKKQYEFIELVKRQMGFIDHKAFLDDLHLVEDEEYMMGKELETIKEPSTLPYL